jgi:hypothetical protein
MRSKADCETCGTTTSFEKAGLYGDWKCRLCLTAVPVLKNSSSSNKESYSNMPHPSLSSGHPDRNITSPSHYKEVCTNNGINPDTGEFKTQKDQERAVDKSIAGKRKGIKN